MILRQPVGSRPPAPMTGEEGRIENERTEGSLEGQDSSLYKQIELLRAFKHDETLIHQRLSG